jgi:CRP-like cAMP-binding protein
MPAGARLLEAGSSDDWNLYLVSGEAELIAADGQHSVVAAGSVAARQPLAQLKPRRYSVVARTPVQFLWLYEPMVSAVIRLFPGTVTRTGAA